MKQFSYKCVVSKNGRRYYKKVNGKWKRISKKIGEKMQKNKKKYMMHSGESFDSQSSFGIDDDILELENGHLYTTICRGSKRSDKLGIISDYKLTSSNQVSFKNDGEEYICRQIQMAEGNYGSIRECSNSDSSKFLAIKSEPSSTGRSYYDENRRKVKAESNELNKVEHLDEHIMCSQIEEKVLNTDGKNRNFVMEYMDGDLFDLIRILRPRLLSGNFDLLKKIEKDMIKVIIKQLICFEAHDLIYADLKLENVLYKCSGPNNLRISLGDLGSIGYIDEHGIPCTYPNPYDVSNKNYGPGLQPINTKSGLWSFIILCLSILDNTNPIRYYKYGFDKWSMINREQKYSGLQRELETLPGFSDEGAILVLCLDMIKNDELNDMSDLYRILINHEFF